VVYIVARSLSAVDWFTGISLYSKHLGRPNKLESHHIFPKSRLYKEGGFSGTDPDDQKKVNEIANRAFLTQKANLKAGTNFPGVYLPSVVKNYPKSLSAQFIPISEELWKVERYEDFLAERRKLIAEAINNFLNELKSVESEDKEKLPDIHNLILKGESETVEFKSSIRWDYIQSQVNKVLTEVIVKTVAAFLISVSQSVLFLNTRGGTLIIGLSDDGTVLGLQNDYDSLSKKNRDGFELHLQQILTNKIGLDRYQLNVKAAFHDIDDNDICSVHVEPSHKPVYIENGNQSLIYIRAGNSTKALNTKEAISYIQEHWGLNN